MNKLTTSLTGIKMFISENKRLLIPLIPFVLLILTFIFIAFIYIFPSQPEPQREQNLPTPTRESSITPVLTGIDQDDENSLEEGDGPITVSDEDASNFQKKETLPNGRVKISLSSERTGRPHVTILSTDGQSTFFESSISSPNNLPSLLEYLNLFGEPERIISGSKFYGSSAQTYVYSQGQGFVFIGDPQTNSVFEVHNFNPMSVEEYIQQFGEDVVKATPAL